MKSIIILILIIELIGALVLGLHFMTYFPTWQEAFIQGLFAAVSATTNAGFDITGASLIPFANDYFVQFIIILLMLLGAIPPPTLLGEARRELYPEDITRAFVVTSVAILIWATSIIIFSRFESHSLVAIIFEVSSAFGTCGLSMGIPSELTSISKIMSAFLMFIGRIGILTFLFIIRGNTIKELYHYPKEKVIIG